MKQYLLSVWQPDGPPPPSVDLEQIGGFTIVQEADLDAALRWAGRLARITGLPIEVRPFQGEVEG